MGELANCLKCDKVFVKITRSICPSCIEEEEKEFQLVYQFLKKRENRQATIPEIAEGTGVSEEQILAFVQAKRLNPAKFPNLHYSCSRCGNPIAAGAFCFNCQSELQSDLKKFEEIEKMNQKEERKRNRTYYTKGQ
ncbi:TIGR03826 family flagellar region protein [Gracilibacillus alcaliphilus]|uniref:TIGR03826 family flagellar region protein n=1 Tax=Gracilibacillus alcaliphilus TaxID=1401441 RepID=UPI00195CAD54|nr:TIGR03826 family flagellar region protein [Gracilibacillus alcaliphilus]MBM7676035.1 flagellar operon protein (TIGR03826 family) [Gracilibacillus alcaliphilus]